MKTHPVLRVTKTGAVEINPAYPVEPDDVDFVDQDDFSTTFNFKLKEEALKEYEQACKEAESGFLTVTNKQDAEMYLLQKMVNDTFNQGGGVVDSRSKPGIYPYTGKVKIEEKLILIARGSSYKLEGSNEIKPADRWIDGKPYIVKKLAILVEPKLEVMFKEEPCERHSSTWECRHDDCVKKVPILVEPKPEVKDTTCKWPDCKCEHSAIPYNCESRLDEIESLRTANKELVYQLSYILETYRIGNKDEAIIKKLISKHSNL